MLFNKDVIIIIIIIIIIISMRFIELFCQTGIAVLHNHIQLDRVIGYFYLFNV